MVLGVSHRGAWGGDGGRGAFCLCLLVGDPRERGVPPLHLVTLWHAPPGSSTTTRRGEIREIIELFKSRGMSHDDATEVIKRMAKYKTFFVNLMMTEELALPVRCARRSKCLPFSGRLAARAHLSSCPAHCCWTLAPPA